MSATKNRRADGTLRPKVRRYRRRKQLARRRERDAQRTPEEKAARRAWLDRFEPGARHEFFKYADTRKAVWLRAFSAEFRLEQEEAWPLLERLANVQRWRKLRTSDGMVVGIAPPRGKPKP